MPYIVMPLVQQILSAGSILILLYLIKNAYGVGITSYKLLSPLAVSFKTTNSNPVRFKDLSFCLKKP